MNNVNVNTLSVEAIEQIKLVVSQMQNIVNAYAPALGLLGSDDVEEVTHKGEDGFLYRKGNPKCNDAGAPVFWYKWFPQMKIWSQVDAPSVRLYAFESDDEKLEMDEDTFCQIHFDMDFIDVKSTLDKVEDIKTHHGDLDEVFEKLEAADNSEMIEWWDTYGDEAKEMSDWWSDYGSEAEEMSNWWDDHGDHAEEMAHLYTQVQRFDLDADVIEDFGRFCRDYDYEEVKAALSDYGFEKMKDAAQFLESVVPTMDTLRILANLYEKHGVSTDQVERALQIYSTGGIASGSALECAADYITKICDKLALSNQPWNEGTVVSKLAESFMKADKFDSMMDIANMDASNFYRWSRDNQSESRDCVHFDMGRE